MLLSQCTRTFLQFFAYLGYRSSRIPTIELLRNLLRNTKPDKDCNFPEKISCKNLSSISSNNVISFGSFPVFIEIWVSLPFFSNFSESFSSDSQPRKHFSLHVIPRERSTSVAPETVAETNISNVTLPFQEVCRFA